MWIKPQNQLINICKLYNILLFMRQVQLLFCNTFLTHEILYNMYLPKIVYKKLLNHTFWNWKKSTHVLFHIKEKFDVSLICDIKPNLNTSFSMSVSFLKFMVSLLPPENGTGKFLLSLNSASWNEIYILLEGKFNYFILKKVKSKTRHIFITG